MAIKRLIMNFWLILLILCLIILCSGVASQLGKPCETWSGTAGRCTVESQCNSLGTMMRINEPIVICQFCYNEMCMCCPLQPEASGSQGTKSKERAAVKGRLACNEFEKGLAPVAFPLVKGGTQATLGEYPHSAALGYQIRSTDKFDFRCGGSLIAPRFVLTAAHCVIRLSDVRLGFVDLNDKIQTSEALQIPIQKIHVHPNYTKSEAYNDIAILELKQNASFSWKIRPVCLHTQPDDLPSENNLFVTGWGAMSSAKQNLSSILLGAQVKLGSVEQCNSIYGRQRILPHGVDSTLMCSHDSRGTRDACSGDSGGPLNLVVDKSWLKYRLVGIISYGFSCGTIASSLYTRVSAHLDFIESIVWPNSSTEWCHAKSSEECIECCKKTACVNLVRRGRIGYRELSGKKTVEQYHDLRSCYDILGMCSRLYRSVPNINIAIHANKWPRTFYPIDDIVQWPHEVFKPRTARNNFLYLFNRLRI